MLALLDFWEGLPKSEKPGRQKQRKNKSYETLLSHKDDPLIPDKLHLFEEIAFNLNKFLARFHTCAYGTIFSGFSWKPYSQFCQKVNPVKMFWRKLIMLKN